MKSIKLAFIFSFILLNGCVIEKSHMPKNEVIKFDFQAISDKYFKSYHPKIFNLIDKPETQYMSIDISKNNMKLGDFNNLEKLLSSDGWIEVDNKNGLYRYCYSEYQSLTLLYPTQKTHYDSNGNIYNYDNYDDWAIEIYFNKYGVDNCIGKVNS